MPARPTPRPIALVALIAAVAATACQEDGTVRIRSIEFAGVQSVDEARLRAVLATRESSVLPWGRRFQFDRARLDADLKRIQTFYEERGFPDARVTGVDVRLNANQDAVDVRLTIEEGEPVIVTALRYDGFEAVRPDALDRLQREVPIRLGAPRDRLELAAAQDLALNALGDDGYPYARVSIEEVPGQGRRVVVTLTAEPGTLAYFGPIEIAGNQSVSSRVIERQLVYRPGELYRRSLVQESQRRLYRMALFRFVNIETLDSDQPNAEVRTRVTVAEGRHQRVDFGLGYGTEDKVRVDGEYQHVNFLGGARSAGMHGRWSSLDRGLRFNLTQPYLFHPRVTLGLAAQRWYTFTPAYQSVLTGGRAVVTHVIDPQTSWSMFASTEDNTSQISDAALNDPTLRDELIALGLDPTTGRQAGHLNLVGLDVQRSTADNLLDATRGYQMALQLEQAGRLIPSRFVYSALTFDVRHYQSIGGRIVIANRLQAGTISPSGDDPANVPFAKKYFLGGATSVRGWGRYEVSPLTASGLPIGGNTLFAFSSEARTVFGPLGGVIFLDGGYVWQDAWTARLDELRYAAGTGLRYRTPIGPLRLDFGYQLNPIDGLLVDGAPETRRWRVHFSIGQAF